MSATTKCVPAVEADDPVAVVEALEVAGALWEKGDRADAIRWVRRAAEAAADAGNTSRLASLARSAADLCAIDRVSAADLEEWLVPAQADPAEAATAPPPVPSKPRVSAAPPPVPSRPPAAPSKAPPVPPSGRPSKAAPSPLQEPPSAVRSAEPSGTPRSAETRLRVSVRASVREPGLLVVRTLAEGEDPPPGTREAFLVMPEALGDTERAHGSVG